MALEYVQIINVNPFKVTSYFDRTILHTYKNALLRTNVVHSMHYYALRNMYCGRHKI
jgi:hypothetical protein